MTSGSEGTTVGKSNFGKYLIIGIIVGVVMVLYDRSNMMRWGDYPPLRMIPIFFSGMFIVPGGVVGWKVGRFIRDALIPDAIFTTEGITGIAKAKIFWAIGPQVIGMFIGAYMLTQLAGRIVAFFVSFIGDVGSIQW